ncbi:hypothetical protein SAMN02910265_03119 [Ruminococcus flavefaciens]|uniref:Uncharacterized protein n=1 Tax=Ruminococcus flavefaciens TaxID=1265 RepID=A0A1H6LEQ6_RUMFL|nr:hypothetical protein [Ruminococcus flavefaciens]SEH86837.1 hypothetical protein SAMN02910265_03119 [Ruminococcus flavefaciens]
MKINLKKNPSFISTPYYIYLAILCFAVAFLFISYYICENKSWWSNLWLNFGYGTFASFVVSLLIDIGNTKRNQNILNTKYRIITSDCIERCYRLREKVRNSMEELYSYYEPMTYDEFVDEGLNPNYNPDEVSENCYDRVLSAVVYEADKLKESADKLVEIIPICFDDRINGKMRHNLKVISSYCNSIRQYYNEDEYKSCVYRIKRVKNYIIRSFPELKDDFLNPYTDDEDEYDD